MFELHPVYIFLAGGLVFSLLIVAITSILIWGRKETTYPPGTHFVTTSDLDLVEWLEEQNITFVKHTHDDVL